MEHIKPTLEYTDDGSATLRHPVFGDTYHSTRGAVGESLHVFIANGLSLAGKDEVKILEVGFGSGLNAWLSLLHGRHNGITIGYHAIELYPVGMETAATLGYSDDPLFMELHNAPWNAETQITEWFNITKHQADITLPGEWEKKRFDLVYFDAFAPETQPRLWTTEIFSRIYDSLNQEGALVTYCSKGTVKQSLREAGFEVKRLPGALGKRHMVRAEKHDR